MYSAKNAEQWARVPRRYLATVATDPTFVVVIVGWVEQRVQYAVLLVCIFAKFLNLLELGLERLAFAFVRGFAQSDIAFGALFAQLLAFIIGFFELLLGVNRGNVGHGY
jgi:hypothetical protein